MKKNVKQWYEVCAVDEIPRRGAVRIVHGETKIAVFKSSSDVIRALEDKCPHKGGPLSDGIVHGDCVTCPLHNWNIDLETGSAMGADEGQVATFNVRVDDRQVYVELGSETELALVH